jgi:uncharacterized membrane protein
MKIFRGILAVVLFVLYALLVHHVNATGQISSLGAALALFPIFLMLLAYASKSHSLKGLILILASIAAAWALWPFIMRNTSYIFWLLDVGLMTVLLITFARTLKPGRKPLCVSFAEIINQGPLPPAHEIYARRVTIAWVLFFAMIIVVSTGLFFFAPLATWSIFVNFVTLPLVGLMFVAEYLVRRQVLTNLPEGTVLDAVRTYMHHQSSTRSAK